jgi:hypothetical protein
MLAGWANEQPAEKKRERGVILPITQKAAEQIRPAQEGAVRRRRATHHDVIAPAGADVPGDSPYAAAKGAAPADAGEKTNGPGPLRPYAYIAGGVGAAGIIGFAVLGAIGKSAENDLRNQGCAPNCSKDETDAIKTKYIVADVLLGVGIASIGTGVALFFLSQPKNSEPKDTAGGLKFDVRGAPGAAYATIDGRF